MVNPELAWSIRARDKSGQAFQSFDRRVRASDAGVKRLGATAATFGGLQTKMLGMAAALAGIGASAGAIRGVVSEMSRLAKDADKVGLLTDEFQRLQYGFGLAGVEASKFGTAMEQFNKRLTEAQTGTGNLKKILDANNLSLFDADGRMKSVNQLLREYADLIAGAGSSQHKLYLAMEAFGRSGGDMVLALRNGAQGVDDLASKAKDAGGVIDDHLLRKAEEVDDRWTAVARNFEVQWKSAILEIVNFLDRMNPSSQIIESMSTQGLQQELADKKAEIAKAKEGGFFGLGGLATGGAFDTDSLEARIAAIEQELGKRAMESFMSAGMGVYPTKPKETVVPGGGGGGSGGLADRITDAEKVLQMLAEEREMIGLTADEQERLNYLRMAGVDANSELGQTIVENVEKLQQDRAATEALAAEQKRLEEQARAFAGSLEYLGDLGVDALTAWVSGADDAEEQLKKMGIQLALLVAQAALLGQGPLAGLFGMSGGGLFAGFFADGGTIPAGQWGIAGENGPEPIMGPATVKPMSELIGQVPEAAGQKVMVKVHNVVDVGVSEKGELQAYVKEEARNTVQSAAPGIVGQAVRATNDQLPSAIQDAQTRAI